MAEICRRAMVEGRVQGVWFRGSTQEQARQLGITGWAKNLPDGRVEVLMCGQEQAIKQLQEWLHEGPPMASVTHVEISEEEVQVFNGFSTG